MKQKFLEFQLKIYSQPRLVTLLSALVFSTANSAFAFGIPGAPAINTAFGLIVNIFIALIEGALMISMAFTFWRSRHGMPEEQAKIFWHFISMVGVFLAPEIFNLILGIFHQSGAQDAGSTWR